MKTFLLFAIVTVCRCALTEDFLSGFETGVFVRNDDRAFKDYNCPRPQANDALAKQIQGLITPMKLMGNMMKEKDDKIIQIIEAVEVFISGVIDLMTLFKGDYDNGDFCSGLVFGKDGSNMLIQLATQFVKHSTKESNRIDTKLLPKPNQRAGESVEDRREAFRNNATQALLDKQKAVNEKVAQKSDSKTVKNEDASDLIEQRLKQWNF